MALLDLLNRLLQQPNILGVPCGVLLDGPELTINGSLELLLGRGLTSHDDGVLVLLSVTEDLGVGGGVTGPKVRVSV